MAGQLQEQTMTIPPDIGDALIDILRKAARSEIMPRYRRLDDDAIATKTSASDLVTIADQRAEAQIGTAIAKLIPGITIVGEEAVADQPTLVDQIGQADKVAIIDPVDGTWNYANGLPLFGVILAIVEQGKTTFGVLYDPVMDDWIYAHAGQGAIYAASDGTQNRLGASAGRDVSELTGFVPMALFSQSQRTGMTRALAPFARTSSLRCSCHEYRLMAEGRVDFALSGLLKPWDHAAGELIFREAGGHAAMLSDGSAYAPSMTDGHLMLAPDEATWLKLRDAFAAPLHAHP